MFLFMEIKKVFMWVPLLSRALIVIEAYFFTRNNTVIFILQRNKKKSSCPCSDMNSDLYHTSDHVYPKY